MNRLSISKKLILTLEERLEGMTAIFDAPTFGTIQSGSLREMDLLGTLKYQI